MTFDTATQAHVDAQLMEQGAFTGLALLLDTGRLMYDDYERWRRTEIELLDEVLMGSPDRIVEQLEYAVAYAREIGLVEQAQDYQAWRTSDHDGGRALRASTNARLQQLIFSRFVPAQKQPQLDLFFDNTVVALANGVVRALCARDVRDAQRQIDLLYAQAPNHADLPGFDRLLRVLEHLEQPIVDLAAELATLRDITPLARRLLGSQARDLLTSSWLRLAQALNGRPFSPSEPELHRSFALSQAQDWNAVSECVLSEAEWQQHAALCLRLAQSSFYGQRRIESLSAWCHLCWRHPDEAANILDRGKQPDSGIAQRWARFRDSAEALDDIDGPELTAAEFPAWLLLQEPGLVQHISEDWPSGDTPAENTFKCIHQWVQARRAKQSARELELRKELRTRHARLFECLKSVVGAK